jgi:hypothetical protein
MQFWEGWFRRRRTPDRQPPPPPLVLIHEAVLPETIRLLRESRDERSAHEGVVYWAGKVSDGFWVVTTVIAPKATTTWGSFETSAAGNAEVIAFLARHGIELLAQTHSHPGGDVGHSGGDDDGALMPYENYLSLIVPNYARDGMLPLATCGVHRYEGGRFRRLGDAEVEAGFRVIPTHQSFR